MILPILKFPNPLLRQAACAVETVDSTVRLLVNNMFETMYVNNGIGIAAPQVGHGLRIICLDISDNHNQGQVFINPIILRTKGVQECEEGCLSVPGIFEIVRRAAWIEIQATNIHGETFITEADGLLAVCIQHEIDHLDGILFISRALVSKSEH